EFTSRAVELVRDSARAVRRAAPAEIVQYIPCAVRRDRNEARAMAKAAIAEMLPGYWALGERSHAARSALLCAEDLSAADFASAAERLRAGANPTDALDDRFMRAFAIAGTGDDCLAQVQRYRSAGATELALT